MSRELVRVWGPGGAEWVPAAGCTQEYDALAEVLAHETHRR